MKILKAKYLLTCDEQFKILENKAVVFDDKIIKIGDFSDLQKEFSNKITQIFDFSKDIVMPSLINSHVHLEFSSNKTTLHYGDFLDWLDSVTKNRIDICSKENIEFMKLALKQIQKSGVGTIGEISSFGSDLDIFDNTNLRVVFFAEILGLDETNVDLIWDSFMTRLKLAKDKKSDLFIPAVSIHSPYSSCKKIALKAIELAKKENMIISTHFLESKYEKDWLTCGNGAFKTRLKKFIKNPSPNYTPQSFISMFKGVRTLWTHCCFAKDYLDLFDKKNHFITHCPRSNKLLGAKKLNFDLEKINIATDGLSSNYSLNIWEELRIALFMHDTHKITQRAKFLLKAVTTNAAKALNIQSGEIKTNKSADFAVFSGFGELDLDQIPLQLILHTNQVEKLFIKGEQCRL